MTDQSAPDTEPTDLPTALIELRHARAEVDRLRPFVDMVDQSQRTAEIADDVTAHAKTLMERRTTTLRERAERAEGERDGAYRERACLVALLAAMTDGAVTAPATDIDEPGWTLLYLNLGGRQASWHISPRDHDLFAHVERVGSDDPRTQWDGHTTEEKYARIAAWTAELAQRCGPACTEQHTETGRCEIARNR
ncbi:hypothetical protein [Streptomyces acidiscabies]|uniref:Uncharacterized protein n=1 Tax=Streptomyces acidiscabies TaxID=42234 RepID=A0ABU4LWF1_9ACTN|nr:hypothetical protein [Streptomyces acidiscabies]MDX3019891.1 hypothetical protein [Streptomyces acidiscabies]